MKQVKNLAKYIVKELKHIYPTHFLGYDWRGRVQEHIAASLKIASKATTGNHMHTFKLYILHPELCAEEWAKDKAFIRDFQQALEYFQVKQLCEKFEQGDVEQQNQAKKIAACNTDILEF